MAITFTSGLAITGGLAVAHQDITLGIVPVADAAFTGQGWTTGTNYTTITNGGTGTWNHVFGGIQGASGGARSIALSEGGSFYFEVQYIGAIEAQLVYGMCRSSSIGGYGNVPRIYTVTGDAGGGMTGGTSVGGFVPGDIMRYAYNATTNKVWLGRNANWYLDPVSTAGTDIPGTGTIQLIFMSGSSGGSSTNGKFRKVSENTFSTPTGFTACSL